MVVPVAREQPVVRPVSKPIPVPVKKIYISPHIELEEDASPADSTSHYEWATWQMYERITNARRLRAISRSGQPCLPAVQQPQPVYSYVTQDHLLFSTTSKQGRLHHAAAGPSGQPLMVEEEFPDVFVLDE